MKKLFLLLFLVTFLFGSDLKTEQKIYGLIIHTLLPDKQEIKVWCDDPSKKEVLHSIQGVQCVSSADKADFLLLSKTKHLTSKGIKFVTNYPLLEADKESVVGGFFW